LAFSIEVDVAFDNGERWCCLCLWNSIWGWT